MITKETLHELYTYKDGDLYYKKIIYGNTRRKVGDKVGYVVNEGYVVAKIKGKSYLVHRLIYMMHNGYIPDQIDHIDSNPANNKIENLRNVTGSQNCMNKKISKRNSSGYKNIHYVKAINKWRVQIKIKGKPLSFGCYEDVELADLVAQEVRNKYAGEFARHN
jgi:hypothetical protein